MYVSIFRWKKIDIYIKIVWVLNKATICSTRYVSEKHFLAKTFHFITFLTFLNHQVNKTPWFTKKR